MQSTKGSSIIMKNMTQRLTSIVVTTSVRAAVAPVKARSWVNITALHRISMMTEASNAASPTDS